MFLKGKFLILLIFLELCIECRGKWCQVTETEYVYEKKKIQVTKYRDIWYKCHWFSLNNNCRRLEPYVVTEYKDEYVPKNVTKNICCSGYVEELGSCKPICVPACSNGRCIAPNDCKCNNGYKIFSEQASHKCVPSCNGCEFGVCIAPEVCKCASGYKEAPKYEQSRCIPDCKETCPRGSTCSQPDTCTCLTGFREIFREDKLRCLGEGETEEPPTTTTELSTTTTTELTMTTTEPTTTTEKTTTTFLPELFKTSQITTTTEADESTDYSEIEEVPDEDPRNSTVLVHLANVENDTSVEIVSDDSWDYEASTKRGTHLNVVYEEIDEDGAVHRIFGKIWYILLPVVVLLCAILSLKFYLRMRMKEYIIDNENVVQVHYTSKSSKSEEL